MENFTYAQLKKKLSSLSRPKLPQYKAEMENNLVQQNQEEPIDAYFLLKLREIRHNLPNGTKEQKIHSLFIVRRALEHSEEDCLGDTCYCSGFTKSMH